MHLFSSMLLAVLASTFFVSAITASAQGRLDPSQAELEAQGRLNPDEAELEAQQAPAGRPEFAENQPQQEPSAIEPELSENQPAPVNIIPVGDPSAPPGNQAATPAATSSRASQTPATSEAGEAATPGGLVAPCEGRSCSACNLADLANNIIKWLIGIMFLLFAVLTVVAGFGLVTSGGNQSALQAAKKKLTNGIIGIVIVLAAWLLVDTMLRALIGDNGEIDGYGPWSEIKCGTQVESTIQSGLYDDVAYVNPVLITQNNFISGILQLDLTGAGACDPLLLGKYFPTEAGSAQCIIKAESTCGAKMISTTDRMRVDKRPFSFGPMQINITVHTLVGCGSGGETLNCPAAFQGKNYDARVVNESLYQACSKAAQNVTCNLENGKIIKERKGGWSDWSTAKGCGLR